VTSIAPDATIGAFTGVPSMLYTALHLAAVWGEPEVLAEQLRALREVKRRIRRDNDLDLMSGAAGCIAVMLRLHRRHPDSPALEIAQACGEHLLRHAGPVDCGRAWRAPFAGQPQVALIKLQGLLDISDVQDDVIETRHAHGRDLLRVMLPLRL